MLRMPIYVMLLVVGLVALFVFMASSPPNNQKPEVVQVKHNKATEAPQAKLDFALALPQESGLASIAASADGKHLALVGNVWSQKEQVNRTELSLFDLDSGKALWSVVYVNPNCCGLPIVKISPDGQLILGAGRKLHLYNKDGQELKVFSFQEDDEFALSGDLSSDGKYVAATSSHRAYLFSQNGQLLWASDFKDVPSVALSGDGTYLLVATSHAFQLFIEPQTSN